jgi:signal recognition particle GTPase
MFKKTEPTFEFQDVLDQLHTQLILQDVRGENFDKISDQIVKLSKLKNESSTPKISPDTLAQIAGSLAGIILIIGHERANVVASKALSFVMKLR